MPKKNSKKPKEMTPAVLEAAIKKRWGDTAIKRASDPSLEITRIPTGILSLDMALGGGVARGRHLEIYGTYSVGKTYVTYRLLGNAQKLGGRGAFIDVEGSFDPRFAKHAGVDLKELSFHEQEHGNRVIDFIETLLRSRLYDVIVLDSIASLLPKKEMEADMEKGSYGTEQAKLMSAALRRLTAANTNTALVYINQTREAVGSMFKKNVTSGGRAMAFYAGTRLEMIRTEMIKQNKITIDPKTGTEKPEKVVVGHRVLVRVEKDKTGGALQNSSTSFVFDYRRAAIDRVEDLLYLGRVYGLIVKSGNFWYVDGYKDEKQNGRGAFKKWLRSNVAVQEDLEEWIREEALEEQASIFVDEDEDESTDDEESEDE